MKTYCWRGWKGRFFEKDKIINSVKFDEYINISS